MCVCCIVLSSILVVCLVALLCYVVVWVCACFVLCLCCVVLWCCCVGGVVVACVCVGVLDWLVSFVFAGL